MFDIKGRLLRLAEQGAAAALEKRVDETPAAVAALRESVQKLAAKQAETGFQVQEVYELAEESSQERSALRQERDRLVGALIAAADMIEDFYLYYREHEDEALSRQSAAMWGSLQKTLMACGLSRIADEGTPFDGALNEAIEAVEDESLPARHVVRVTRSGYLYGSAVVRKSSAVVNRRIGG